MENSFLKDAINRIVELATPFTLETRSGHQFCSANLREVKPEVELPARYSVDTLEALVKLIRTEGVAQTSLLYVRVDSARRVVVDSTYTGRDYAIYSRLPLYEAVSDVPSISVNQYMSQEHAVIELQSLYAVTDDRDYLLALLSRIDVNQGVSSVDNGISQEVSVRTGAVLKEQQTVQPIVHLQPYRTFLEVEQPASDFLLRLDKDGRPALYEARDPELRQTNTGKQVATFTLAVDRGRKDANGKSVADWIPVIAWERAAEFAYKWLTKGQMVAVDGRLQSRTYTARDGTSRTVLEVVANNINFCGSKADNAGTLSAPTEGPRVGAPAPEYSRGPGDDFAMIEDEGDLPF